MRIVCDEYIPFIAEAVSREWEGVEIIPMKPELIDASSVRQADVLVVRTRTRVDGALLDGSRVRMVCTATIGYDHIDTAYCESHNVEWVSCPGCNAQAVCDYIEEVIEEVQRGSVLLTREPVIGVVGVGHVGSKVAAMAERKGYRVLLNDPPKGIGVSLDEIAQTCDIITFHVPLTGTPHSGGPDKWPTYHLCDASFLSQCRPGALVINASRGGVVDEAALLSSSHPFVLDTWEGEPNLSLPVVGRAWLGSMHIAGYSVEGKRNASQMCLDAIARTFNLPPIRLDKEIYTSIFPAGDNAPGWLARVSAQLKAEPALFEQLRKNYPLR